MQGHLHADGRPHFHVRSAFTPANLLADRFLHVMIYITVVSSFFVFVEPAPYEYLAFVLGGACVLARVTMCSRRTSTPRPAAHS